MPGTAMHVMTPSFAIRVNGSLLPWLAEVVISQITVEEDTQLPGMFTLDITGSELQDTETQWIDDTTLYAIGNAVDISLGYIDQLDSLIKGEITGLEPEFSRGRLPRLTIRGYDRRHRLQRGRKTRTFLKQKDSAIAAQIASEAGLTAQTTDSQVIHDYVLQANQSDWQFLQQRAAQINYEVIVDDRTLQFRPVQNATNGPVTLTLDDDLLVFTPRLSSMGQVSDVMVRGWDLKDQKAIVSKAKSGDEVSLMGGQDSGAKLVEKSFGQAIGQVSDRPSFTQAEADQVAQARFNQSVLELMTGDGTCRGRTDIHAGQVIKIDGIGKRFSGQYYVTSTRHSYGPSGYYTHFTVRRNAL